MGFTIDIKQLRTRAAIAASPAKPPIDPEFARPALQRADPYAGFQRHYEALVSHGLTEGAAFDIAEAICLEREQDGDRHVCAVECRHYRRGCCMRPQSAGVPPRLGELAFIPQRCAAYEPTR